MQPGPPTVRIELRFFATLREALGAQEQVLVHAGSTVGEVRDGLLARGGAYAHALARGRAVRCALNHVMCDESATVREGAEVAFFPPVTGG